MILQVAIQKPGGGWTNPSGKKFVKFDHFPKVRGDTKKKIETTN